MVILLWMEREVFGLIKLNRQLGRSRAISTSCEWRVGRAAYSRRMSTVLLIVARVSSRRPPHLTGPIGCLSSGPGWAGMRVNGSTVVRILRMSTMSLGLLRICL
jgi:hypothetical protein